MKNRKIPKEIHDKYFSLIDELEKYEYSYYCESRSLVSDTHYDAKYYELQRIEEVYPNIIVPYSPTQRVGGTYTGDFKKVTHIRPMLSLDKVNNDADALFAFFKKIKYTKKAIVAEHKLDGLTLVITYKHGLLYQAVTRGNGIVGEDVTHTARTISNLPLRIAFKGTLTIRGEAFLLRTDFLRINKELSDAGMEEYSTCRNLASGSLRQKDPAVCAKRNLMFHAYDIIQLIADDDTQNKFDALTETDTSRLRLLDVLHIPVVEYATVTGYNELRSYIKKQTNKWKKGSIPYDIDGLVFKVNNIAYRNELGDGVKYPNWAMAYKFEDDTFETKLEDIVVQVSRSRRLNPVGIISPVDIDGTEVTRCTLNNYDFIKQAMLGIGDTIIVKKANGVIPNFVESVTMGNSVVIPDKCPECGAQTVRKGAYLYCSNKNCIGAKIKIIRHFASRNAMDIRGLSNSRIYDLIEHGIINDVWDLYNIKSKKREIVSMEYWGMKSYLNLYNSIDKSRTISMERFLYALGIPMLGLVSAGYLCEYADWDLMKILDMSEYDLRYVHDFGVKTAHIVYKGLHSKWVKQVIDKLVISGEIEFLNEEIDLVSTALEGKVFCITGTLSKKREDFVDIILSHGGSVTDGIRKNTTHLLAGKQAGSKLDTAKSKGIPVIDEATFNKMLEY